MAKKKAVAVVPKKIDATKLPATIIGLDLSTSCVGWAHFCIKTASLTSGFWDIEPLKLKGMERIDHILGRVFELLGIDDRMLQHVFIEGYGFNSNKGVVLAELGGVIRHALWEIPGVQYTDIQPLMLKRFLLGKGVGDKSQMLKELYKRYGYDKSGSNPEECLLDDECDALTLAELGRAVYGLNAKPLVQFQKDVVSKL